MVSVSGPGVALVMLLPLPTPIRSYTRFESSPSFHTSHTPLFLRWLLTSAGTLGLVSAFNVLAPVGTGVRCGRELFGFKFLDWLLLEPLGRCDCSACLFWELAYSSWSPILVATSFHSWYVYSRGWLANTITYCLWLPHASTDNCFMLALSSTI